MRKLFLLLSLQGCYMTDSLDGDIETVVGCCVYWPSEDKIHDCVLDLVEPGFCQNLTCTIPGQTITVRACYSEMENP